jgi:hypothetical protein
VRCGEHAANIGFNVVEMLLHRPLLLLCALHRDLAQLDSGAVLRGGSGVGLAEEFVNGDKLLTLE